MIVGYRLTEYKEYDVKLPVFVTLPKKNSNVLVTGKSGSGKSQAVLWFIYNVLATDESRVYISDYKAGEEYEILEKSFAYAQGKYAIDMIKTYYDFFTKVRENKLRLKHHYTLVIEEYSGLLNWCEMQDKKLKNEVMRMVGELLAVGRGLNIGVMIILQRADASYFASGARDQFQCIINFGRCSAEQFRMLGFANELDNNPTSSFSAGQALLLVDGQESVRQLIIPMIKNVEDMKNSIVHLLDRQLALTELVHTVAQSECVDL